MEPLLSIVRTADVRSASNQPSSYRASRAPRTRLRSSADSTCEKSALIVRSRALSAFSSSPFNSIDDICQASDGWRAVLQESGPAGDFLSGFASESFSHASTPIAFNPHGTHHGGVDART